jgi:hypothetical protein
MRLTLPANIIPMVEIPSHELFQLTSEWEMLAKKGR